MQDFKDSRTIFLGWLPFHQQKSHRLQNSACTLSTRFFLAVICNSVLNVCLSSISLFPGQGGRLGAKGATLSQYVVQQLVKRKADDRDKDPRAAILRHAEEAEKNPFWVTPAYTSYVFLPN